MALDAELLKLFGIKGIDAAHAADIVVHEAHLDALFYLAREHFEDLVPEFAFLDDEVLHEDVFLGALQIGNEAGAERLANGEVLRLGVLVDERRVVAAQERLAYVRPAAHLCIQAGARNAAIFKLTGIFKDLYRARAVLAAGAVRGKGRVDGDAEQSERDDAQDPRDLGLGDHVAVGGVNGGDEHDDARDRLYDEDAPGRRKLLVDQQNEEIGQKVTEPDGDADFDQKEQKDGHGDDEKPTEQFFEHFSPPFRPAARCYILVYCVQPQASGVAVKLPVRRTSARGVCSDRRPAMPTKASASIFCAGTVQAFTSSILGQA